MDYKDKFLLYNLTKDSRQTYSQLAAVCGMSKERTRYRILGLKNENLIRNFTAYINITRLGYHSMNIYVKFHNITDSVEKKMVKYLLTHDKVDWFCVSDGRWDMIISVVSKNVAKFSNFLNNFESLFGKYINEKCVSVLIDEYIFSHDYLLNKNMARYVSYLNADADKLLLDRNNIELIKILSLDARAPLTSMAKKLNMSPEAVKYRIKWLEKKNIILGFKMHLDYSRMDMKQSRVFLYLNSMNKDDKKRFLQNIANISNVIYVRNCIAPWDMEVHVVSEKRRELRNIVKKITNYMPGAVKTYDSIRIYDIHKMDYFPMKD